MSEKRPRARPREQGTRQAGTRETGTRKIGSRAELGGRGESLAAEFLECAGIMVVERNYRCRAGEIDLIAIDGETVVFVEVKLRRGDFDPLEAVDPRKQGQIARAAFDYLIRRGLMSRSARFDVIAVSQDGPSGWDIRHVVDAFDSPIEY